MCLRVGGWRSCWHCKHACSLEVCVSLCVCNGVPVCIRLGPRCAPAGGWDGCCPEGKLLSGSVALLIVRAYVCMCVCRSVHAPARARQHVQMKTGSRRSTSRASLLMRWIKDHDNSLITEEIKKRINPHKHHAGSLAATFSFPREEEEKEDKKNEGTEVQNNHNLFFMFARLQRRWEWGWEDVRKEGWIKQHADVSTRTRQTRVSNTS